jgi:hypothetical protein
MHKRKIQIEKKSSTDFRLEYLERGFIFSKLLVDITTINLVLKLQIAKY